MPHDSRGVELQVGDRVTMELEVTGITPGEEACNGSFVAVPPTEAAAGEYRPSLSCNTRLVTKVVEIVTKVPAAALLLLSAFLLAGCVGTQEAVTPGGVQMKGTAAQSVYESEETGVNYAGETAPHEFDTEDVSYFGSIPPSLFNVNPETGKIVYVGTENMTAGLLELRHSAGEFYIRAENLGTDRAENLLAVTAQIDALTAQVEANNITQQQALRTMEQLAQTLAEIAVTLRGPGIN